MREFFVEVLTSFAQSNPYLLGAAALIGSFWLLRSILHKARIFTDQLTVQVRDSKGEIHEWANALRELKRELTTWKVGDRQRDAKSDTLFQTEDGQLRLSGRGGHSMSQTGD